MSRQLGFNRRRDACFLATGDIEALTKIMHAFQSQTRRLLPRNLGSPLQTKQETVVSIADATLASSQPRASHLQGWRFVCFNRRRDACFLATEGQWTPTVGGRVSIADATLASSQHIQKKWIGTVQAEFQSQTRRLLPRNVQHPEMSVAQYFSFNRRRDACFLATSGVPIHAGTSGQFQSQTRRLLPRNASCFSHARVPDCFNRRRDACFLATNTIMTTEQKKTLFQSQTRRLLPRNPALWLRSDSL